MTDSQFRRQQPSDVQQYGMSGSIIREGDSSSRNYNISGATITNSNIRPANQEIFRSPMTNQEQKGMQSPSTGLRQFTSSNLGSSNVYRSSEYNQTISPQIGTPSREYKRDTDRTGGGGDESGRKWIW